MFFHLSQNNSGGYYIKDEKYGICENLILEANNEEEILSKLEELSSKVEGFYDYCQCCGERWSLWIEDDDFTEIPTIYGEDVYKKTANYFNTRAFIHYKNGSIEEVKFKKD